MLISSLTTLSPLVRTKVNLAAYRSSIPLIFMVVAFEHTFLYVLNLSSHLSSNSIGTWLRFAIAILGLVTEAARLVLTQKLLQGQV
jgi:hypothetical protein